jgi:hypothetical protein
MRASPSTFLFEHILFVRAVLWLTDFTGWTSTACQQTGPSTQPLVPPAMFDPYAVALDFRVMARDAHMRVPEIGLGTRINLALTSVARATIIDL